VSVTAVRRRVYALHAARWLAGHVPGVEIDWETLGDRGDEVFPPLLPRFLTGAETDAIDSNDLSSREVIDAARGERPALVWLLDRLEHLLPPRSRVRLWTLLDLPLRVPRFRTPPPPRRTGDATAASRPAAAGSLQTLRLAVADAPAALLAALGSREGDLFEASPADALRLVICLPRAMFPAGVEQPWASAVWDAHGRLAAVAVGELLPHRIDLRFERWPAANDGRRAMLRLHRRAFRRWYPLARIVVRGQVSASGAPPSPAAIGTALLTGSLSPSLERRLRALARRAPGASGVGQLRRLVGAAPLFEELGRVLRRSPTTGRRRSR